MHKGIIFCLMILLPVACNAANVAERVKCDDVKAQIDAMASDENADAAQLAELRNTYRKNCVRSAAGRASRTIAVSRAPVASSADTGAGQSCEPDEYGCCPGEVYTDMGDAGFNCCPASGDGMCFQPIKTASQPASTATPAPTVGAVCDTPDENGCCPDEILMDMGEQGMNCCPKTGGDCFPPIK
ncbi:MAG: hypothetical protein K2L95_00300 [Alphaproteobacteria bacterium]|nr:hypothetical protein [Alphaproteobacteria bacterium]